MIRKNLTALEKLMTKLPDEAPIAGLSKAAKVGTFFTDDCIITLGSPIPDIRERSELVAIVHRSRQAFYKVNVNFADISISVPDKDTAEVTLTATAIVHEPGGLMGELEAREVELTLAKIGRSWKIKKVVGVETLH